MSPWRALGSTIAATVLAACVGDEPADRSAVEIVDGMVRISGGSFVMGRASEAHPDEGPPHRVTLSPYWMDATLVTVAAFRAWARASGYRSVAETHGFGMVSVVGMGEYEWQATPGATWELPFGPAHPGVGTGDDHPVTQVAWVDADAYCRGQGKRLPTEAEWEFAMRAGREGTRFPWGDAPNDGKGRLLLNFWQGRDHRTAEVRDGYLYTSPVRTYPPNAWGLSDPVGNVWQFVADWYAPDTYARDAAGVFDPQGPPHGWARVARGGSWWCSDSACSAYGLHARGKQQPTASYANNGFRCAADG